MAEGRDDWVRRVLGVALPVAGEGGARLLPLWQDAKERIDARLATLADAFRAEGDPLGVAIAEQGLPLLTGKLFVGLVASLFDHDGAPPPGREAARARVRERLGAFRAELAPGGLWATLDGDPLGARAGLCAIIGGSLDGIERALG